MNTSPVIVTHGLTRRFGDIMAVDGLDLEVRAGEVLGFLGHNGSGKTTTVRLLNGVLTATAGSARVLGLDPAVAGAELRRRTGVLTETPSLDERLTASENLTLFAQLYGVPEADVAGRVAELLETFQLAERAADRVSGFSKGMKQRLALARALLHEPELLFLDEPTSGLDPVSTRQVHTLIRELSRNGGHTVFLCTHNLDEADRLCDRIGVMKQRLITVDTPANLRQKLYGRKVVFHLREADDALLARVRALPFIKEAQRMDNKFVLGLDDPETHNPALVRLLVEAGADIRFVGELRHSLEDVYLSLVGAGGVSTDSADETDSTPSIV